MAFSKIIFNDETLIDLTQDTVDESTLFDSYTAHDASGQAIVGEATGGGSAIAIIDTLDAAGGTIRDINAVSLAEDTVAPEYLLVGYTAHNSQGQAIVGTASNGYSLIDVCEHNFTGSITYSGTNLKGGTFQGSSITEIHLPNIGTFNGAPRGRTFYNCSSLTVIDCPNLDNTANADNMFGYCTSLQSVYLPKLHTIGNNMFEQCTSLKYAVFPMIKNTGWNIFNGSNGLLAYDCGKAERTDDLTFSDRTFNGVTCSAFIIRQTKLAKLANTSDLTIPINFRDGGSGGTIYIPETLYDHLGDGTSLDYKSATNWSVVDAYGTITWAKIEGSQYENYYADGTPVPSE